MRAFFFGPSISVFSLIASVYAVQDYRDGNYLGAGLIIALVALVAWYEDRRAAA